jgi:hypothetical protein
MGLQGSGVFLDVLQRLAGLDDEPLRLKAG